MPLALNRDGVLPVEALDYFERKGLKVGFDHGDVAAEEHHRAFTAAKVMREDVLDTMRGEVNRALREGRTYQQFAGELEDRLKSKGWWGDQRVIDPETGREADINVPSRLHRIFDTNMRTARAAGQWQRIVRTKDTHPFLLYQVGPSREHRIEHLGWHGLVLPVDDPWWQEHFPPNGYGCKCWVRQLSRREAARLGVEGVRVPSPRPILGPDGLPTGHVEGRRKPVRTTRPRVTYVDFRNKRTGQVEKVPRGVEPGFHKPPSSLTNFQSTKPTPPPKRDEMAQLEREVFGGEARPSRPIEAKEVGELLARAIDAHPQDGGLSLRRLGRAIVRDHLGGDLRQGTTNFPDAGRLEFRRLPNGVLGSQDMRNGLVFMSLGGRTKLKEAAAALRAGRRLNKKAALALETLVHETIHGFGFDNHAEMMRYAGRSKVGRASEEIITETLARKVMREKFGADMGYPRDAQSMRPGQSYERLLLRAKAVLEEVAKRYDIGLNHPDAAVLHARTQAALEEAALRMRTQERIVANELPDMRRLGIEVRDNPFTWALVDALPLAGQNMNVLRAKLEIYSAFAHPSYLADVV
jgi:hypothetical protein